MCDYIFKLMVGIIKSLNPIWGAVIIWWILFKK